MAQSSESMDTSDVKDADKPNSEAEPVIPGYSNVNEYSQHALRSVLQATRTSNDLPTGDDYDFYSTYSSVRDVLDIEGKRILHLIQNILKQQNVKANMSSTSDAIDLEDKFDTLMDANDQILERVGSSLDEAAGIRKPEATLVVATATQKTATAASWNKAKSSPSSSSTFRLLAARNIQRPQLKFKDKIDNSNRPFIPQIKVKPNAQLSLDESLKLPEDITVEDLERPDFVYPHPYQYELDHLQPDVSQLSEVKVQEPPPLNKTPLKIIDKAVDLHELCDHLKTVKEMAVDLEAHSYRTFQGITCLMQISTRDADYIIDTLAVREDMHILNEVFTNPNILKVLHGSEGDVEWLQRDFNLYIVNMFDTGQAARVLQHSRFSLAHLLKIYCQVDADKQFQLADWRIRPLPDELVKYAREDTHYLLYIYDKMKNELLQQGNQQKNLLHSVLSRSSRICKQVYKKQVFTMSQYMELYKKSKKIFTSQQLQAFREIYTWRDKVARIEDESIGYVLPNHMMLQMSEILPREKQGVLACCNPIPPLVRQNLSEIHNIIMQARETPLVKVDQPKPVYPSETQHPKYDSNSLLNCPHDLSHPNKTLPDNNTQPDSNLIASSPTMFGDPSISIALRDKALISAFSWPTKGTNTWRESAITSAAEKKAEEIRRSFISPFQMYWPGDKVKSHQKKPSAGRDDMTQSVNPWKLKPNTAVNQELKHKLEPDTDPITGQPVHIYEPPSKKAKVDTVTNPTITQEEMDTEVLLRQDMPRKKKKKKKHDPQFEAEVPASMQDGPVRGNFLGAEAEEIPEDPEEEPSSNVTEEHMKRKKKKKKHNLDEVEEGFQPYDYSNADKTIFQGSSSSKDEFNPGGGKFKKGKREKKQKQSSNRGNRSLTYKQGGGHGGNKRH